MYWDWCIATKYVAGMILLVGLGWMWSNQDRVVDAYTDERSVAAIQIDPLSFSVATVPRIDPDSMSLATAPDTGSTPLSRLAESEPALEDPVIAGGSATLYGTVSGLGEDDIGEVRLTRVTDGGQAEVSVPIEADGSWRARDINGGRYRVRALVPNLRASNGASVVFLAKAQNRELSLSVTTPPQGLLFDAVGPEAPAVGGRAVVAITVGRQVVDGDGRSIVSPVAGTSVSATFSPVVSLLSAAGSVTDAGGAVRFLVHCDQAGTATATISVLEPAAVEPQSAVLTLPACVVPPPPDDDPDDAAGDEESSDG